MGTTSKGYPYPEGTDPVVDGDDAIQALAQAINNKLPYAVATGTRSITNVAPGETKSFAIAYPSGRFAAAPDVTLGNRGLLPAILMTSYGSGTATGFTMYVYNARSSSIGSTNVSWHAIQSAAGAAVLLTDEPAVEPDAVVTCPTIGCENQGISIEIASTWTDEDGATQPVDGVYCGVCNAEITSSLQETP